MICLSFDTDHMSEARMREFLELVEIPGTATFFCTQPYKSLECTGHELCPHPYLGAENNWPAELQNKRKQFPVAQGWRSHSCIFSHLLAEDVAKLGYRYVSTHDDFGRAGLRPHRHCWGVWQMPIYYMDNLDFSRTRFWHDGPSPFASELIEKALGDDGIYIFDFHPIHLMLNTDSPAWYFTHRDPFLAGAPTRNLSNAGYGVRNYYEALRDRMIETDTLSVGMDVALTRFIEASKHYSA